MKLAASTPIRLTFFLLLVLLLVACERPLQEPPDLQATPDTAATTLPNPTPIEPSADETPGATPGTGDQPTTGAAPEENETPVTPTETPPSTTSERTEEVIYRVVAGDTLGKIAERYGISIEALAAANDIANPNVLEVGQQLVIPVPGDEPATSQDSGEAAGGEEPRTEEEIYTVQAGDNLYRIGLQFGVAWEDLAAFNNISPPYRLEVGQQIRIPPEGNDPN